MTLNWHLINELLSKKVRPKEYYIATANRVFVEWRDEEKCKKALQI
jgi:hypothetical protein